MQKINSLLKDLHVAKVIDNNHDDKNGLIKISIPYLHFEIQESLLPWALPLHNFLGGSSTAGVSVIPEIDSYVYVFFENEELHKNPIYVGNVNSKDVKVDSLFEDNIKSNITGFESNYPNVKFLITDNGICIGFSTESEKPEVFIYHPNAQIYVDKDGNTNVTATELRLNGDADNAVRYSELTKVVEELQNDITTLKNVFTGWTPVPNDGGAVLKTASTVWASTSLTENMINSKVDEVLLS